MKAGWIALAIAAALPGLMASSPVQSEEPKPVVLAAPQTEDGKPLMQVLKQRRTAREFGAEALPPQVLSNLLWAAFGVNRPESGGRTAPSAHNAQEIDIYVALAEGLYLYDAKAHTLRPIVAGDIRALTGRQHFVADAPVNLIYVANFSRLSRDSDEDKVVMSAADAGFIGQNVYLYCASEGLATMVRASIDRPALAKAMKLGPGQRIILAQSVGYPKR